MYMKTCVYFPQIVLSPCVIRRQVTLIHLNDSIFGNSLIEVRVRRRDSSEHQGLADKR